ncbi:MAG TPA: alkaline phosphatase family protein [Thermoanaerobaculia bacterium]|nr:alkaline phosphatase family protein [Thermoanaerobaculia bacterium]
MSSGLAHSRTVLIGVDGFAPSYADQLISAGRLPALARLARDGAQVPIVSTIPATTPVAWSSLITGAPPSVTGIDGFLIRAIGKRLDQRISGCYAHRCKAEPLWEAAQRAGKRAYVVKFPISYPSKAARFRLDGAAGWGGLKCFHEIASMSVASTKPVGSETQIETTDPGDALWRGTWRLRHLWNGPDIFLHLALLRDHRITIATDRIIATLRASEWSEPLTLTHEGRADIVEVSFRIKVLDASSERICVFNTPLHERSGHSSPDLLWQSMMASCGPVEEQSDPSLMFATSLDLHTQLEIFGLNVSWLGRVAEWILTNEPWDLVMLHTHVLDWAHHLLQGGLDARHPSYDAGTAPRFREALDGTYELVDRWIASIVSAAGPGANIVVAGDHGQDVVHTVVHLNEWLAREGWLVRADDGEIAWHETQAWAAGNYIYLNLAGRDDGGIVAPEDAGALRDAIVAKLYDLADPRNGAPPVLIAGPKEDFDQFGANGAGSGDVVLCFRSGYQASNAFGEMFEPALPLRAFTSNHDHYWPPDPAIQTRLIASGPSFAAGYVHPQAEPITRIAATLSAALGIDAPRQARRDPITAILRGAAEPIHEQPLTIASATWPL